MAYELSPMPGIRKMMTIAVIEEEIAARKALKDLLYFWWRLLQRKARN